MHRSPRTLIIGALAVAALALAACGGSSGSSGGVADGSDERIPAGAPFIDQDKLKFIPTELTVRVGETVYFKNSETALHTVTINGKNLSGNMKKNDLFIWTPEEAGTYRITCEYHPQMKATITVNDG